MDNQDIRTLKILEEIDAEHVPSQRDLARKLDVSLGLVNSFIKRLAQKGYFKITTIPKNRMRYILTPKGAAEKTRLTYEFIHYSFLFYKDSRRRLQQLFNKLESQGVHKIVFYGMSDFAEIAYISLQEKNIQLVAIVDNEKNGQKFLSLTATSPEKLSSIDYDRILITDPQNHETILKRLTAMRIPDSRIVLLE